MDPTERAQLERLVERFNEAYRLTRPAARLFGLVPGWAIAVVTREHRNKIAISYRVLGPRKLRATSPLRADAATKYLLDEGWLDDALAYLERTGGADDDEREPDDDPRGTDDVGAAAPDEVAAGRRELDDAAPERHADVGGGAREGAARLPSAR